MESGNAPKPEILIVSGGPAGLVLALTLRRNGVLVRIIEKSTEDRKGQRGAGIMPRTLELFEALGVYDTIISRALSMPTVIRMYKMPEGVEILKEFEPSPSEKPTPSTPYINPCLLGQDNLDKILRAELATVRCEVELGVELVDFTQFDDYVEVKLVKHKAGDVPVAEEASYQWIVGADGAKGIVRSQVGLQLLGETSTERFVAGDARIEGLSNDRLHIWGEMSNVMLCVRATENPGIYNFFLGGSKLENPDEMCANEETMREHFKKYLGGRDDIKIGEFTWLSPYRANIRMTEQFKKGRVFLVGDAGHVHSPAGGQGLNTSVQDGFNLGWKLALVVKGLSPLLLLETFNEERHPVVAQMLKISTALLKKTISSSSVQGEEGWNRSGNIKQLGVNYRWSSIVIDDEKAAPGEGSASTYDVIEGTVHAGDRAPDAPGLLPIGKSSDEIGPQVRLFKLFSPARHTVLVFAELTDYQPVLDILQKYPSDLVRVVIIAQAGKGTDISPNDQSKAFVVEDRDGHARDAYIGANGAGRLGLYVIRPDGVVGARVGSVEGIGHYFQNIF